MPQRYHICIANCLYSNKGDFHYPRMQKVRTLLEYHAVLKLLVIYNCLAWTTG